MYLHMCGPFGETDFLATRVPSGPGREAHPRE
jgi:hypothetical protein